MADLVIPIRLDKGQAKRDADNFGKELAGILREADKEAVRSAKEASQARGQVAREEARNRQQLMREAAALLKEAERDQARSVQEASRIAQKAAKDRAQVEKEAAQETFKRWKNAMDAQHMSAMQAWDAQKGKIKENEQAIASTNSELGNLIKAQIGLAALQRVAGLIADDFKRTADEVMKSAEQFQVLRQAMQQIAALKEQPNQTQFALEEVNKAQKVGLTPQEWKRSQEVFLNFAGALIGNQPGAKMSAAESEEFQARIAAATKAQGFAPELGMQFGGSILQQSKRPLTAQQAMAQFNPGFQVLQKGPVELGQAMPMMSQLMAHGGISPAEAATMINLVAPASPNEVLPAAEGALRAMEEMSVKGKGEQFGVTDQMTKFQALKAFGRNIAEREADLRGQGMTDEEIEKAIARQLKEADVAGEIRERRGLVRGIARQGIALGGFERFEAIGRATPTDFDRRVVRGFEASDEGLANRTRVANEAENARMGARNEQILLQRQAATAELTAGGQFENVPAADRALGLHPARLIGLADDTRTQQINRQALRRVRMARGEEMSAADNLTSMNQAATDSLLRELLAETKTQTAMMKMRTRAGENPPMAAVPPPRLGQNRMAAP
jgi:hypothetical protein